jgi:hypothetical protein
MTVSQNVERKKRMSLGSALTHSKYILNEWALPKPPSGSSKSTASCSQEAFLVKNGKANGFSYAVVPLHSSLFSCHMEFLALR